MSAERAELEEGYRRWLAWYPGWFRRDHEDEILAVLLDGARPGQRRPAPAECLDLAYGGLATRLRPRLPHSDGAARAAVWLMYAGAAVELAVLVTLLVTLDDIRATILDHDPGYTPAQWHTEVAGTFLPLAVALAISAVVWLWLAWARGRGHRWASVVFACVFLENGCSLLYGMAHGSATYTPAVLAAGGVLWGFEAVVMVLLIRAESHRLRSTRHSRQE